MALPVPRRWLPAVLLAMLLPASAHAHADTPGPLPGSVEDWIAEVEALCGGDCTGQLPPCLQPATFDPLACGKRPDILP